MIKLLTIPILGAWIVIMLGSVAMIIASGADTFEYIVRGGDLSNQYSGAFLIIIGYIAGKMNGFDADTDKTAPPTPNYTVAQITTVTTILIYLCGSRLSWKIPGSFQEFLNTVFPAIATTIILALCIVEPWNYERAKAEYREQRKRLNLPT